MHALSDGQLLNQATHAVHAAGLLLPDNTLIAIREDVGRLLAISAPTALAVRVAQSCGMTLVAVARGGPFEFSPTRTGFAIECR
ncbi:formate dehydrogenase accessory sulfurtransferase FdhD [Bradyrhizobium sp. I1.14.4]|uniref:formate dehydrogenase accessory sulfurtransferase FdhD n=1 Tax=unclassified Bradyrhizobium TaxID=2631580 RepID=UPI003D19E8A3